MSISLPFISPSRTILLVGDDALHIYKTGGNTHLVKSVSWESKSFEEDVSHIISKECHSKSVLMLYDKVEQHYRKERMPKVGLLDKSSVLERKLRIVFPQHNVRAALKLKESDGFTSSASQSEGGLYLFSAIPGNENFKRMMEAVRRSMAPISGFFLLPVESSDMVRALADKLSRKAGIKAKWVVFIGQHQNGGLRQVVIKGNELALTRMTPIVDTDIDTEVWTDEVVQEFNATISYLSRFGYSAEEGLEVIVIANQDVGDILSAKIDTPCHFTTLTASEAADLIGVGIRGPEDERYADVLHAAWSGRKRNFILPMKANEVSNIYKPRQAAVFIMFILFCGMIFLIWQLSAASQGILSISEELDTANSYLRQAEAKYKDEVERKKSMGFDVELVQGTLKAYSNITRQDLNSLDVFKNIGLALGARMTIKTISIERKVKGRDDGKRRSSDIPEGSIFMDSSFTMEMSSDLGPTMANNLFENLRSRIAGRMPDAEVEIAKKPYDNNYNVEISGQDGVVKSIEKEEDYIPKMIIRRRVK